MTNDKTVTVSIVSHGHGSMVEDLVGSLLEFPEIKLIIVTINIPEDYVITSSEQVIVINNPVPRGFGANHNTAFNFCKTEFFCVLNPDIIFLEDPFNVLIGDLKQNKKLGLVAPLIKNKLGNIEDSARPFLSLSGLLRRNLFFQKDAYFIPEDGKIVFPPWLAGMFMLYRSTVYGTLHGFDEDYFLYVEDADICTRAWLSGYHLALDPRVSVIHDARRNSLKKWDHFCWHLCSVVRYFYKFTFRLPKINSERK